MATWRTQHNTTPRVQTLRTEQQHGHTTHVTHTERSETTTINSKKQERNGSQLRASQNPNRQQRTNKRTNERANECRSLNQPSALSHPLFCASAASPSVSLTCTPLTHSTTHAIYMLSLYITHPRHRTSLACILLILTSSFVDRSSFVVR